MHRPRRLRKNPVIRELIAETRLSKDMFIYPYFVVPGTGVTKAIDAMPGVNHFSTDTLLKDVEKGLRLGVNKIMLFGVGDEKSDDAKSAYDPHSLVPVSVRELKKNFGDDLYVVTDVCVCSYTTHGHCGIMKDDYIQNDLSVDLIAKMALNHAEAGADMLFPEAITELAMYKQFADLTKVPVLANITEFGSTPLFTTEELASADVSIALYPLSAFRAMNKAAENVYETLRKEGTQKNVVDTMQTRQELYERINYHAFEQYLDGTFEKAK